MSSPVRMGWSSKIGAAASSPNSPPADPTEQLEVMSFGVTGMDRRENADGLTGQQGFYDDRFVKMSEMSQGPIVFEPKPADLLAWLPRIFGDTGTGSGPVVFGTGATPPQFDLFAMNGDGMYAFREMQIASATFESGEGQRFRCTLNTVGKTMANRVLTYTWSAGLTYERATPWMFGDCNLQMNSGSGLAAFKFYRFAFTVDFMLQPRFMAGSYAPTEYVSTGRRIMLGLSSPWGNGLPIHHRLRTDSVAADLRMTYGTGGTERYFRAEFGRLRPPENRTPVIPGREEIRYDVELQALLGQPTTEVPDPTEVTVTVKAA
jgi:hypothetical protein